MKKLAHWAARFASPYPMPRVRLPFVLSLGWRIAHVAILALAYVFAATAAYADASTSVDVGGIWGAVQPVITAVVTALIGYVSLALVSLLKQRTGIQLDDSMRDSLQTAVTNGAGLVLNKLGNQLQGKTVDVKNSFVAEAVNYVIKAAPGAISHFGLSPDDIAHKVVALLPQVANTAVAPAAAK